MLSDPCRPRELSTQGNQGQPDTHGQVRANRAGGTVYRTVARALGIGVLGWGGGPGDLGARGV